MAIERQETNEFPNGVALFSKQRRNNTSNDKLGFFDSLTYNSSGSQPSTDAIIIIDEDEMVTLEPMKKKPRFGSRRDNVDPFDELSCVVKGLPQAKGDDGVASIADYFSFDLHEANNKNEDERSLPMKENKHESTVGESSSTRNKGYEHVTLEDLGVSMEELKNIQWESYDPTWEIRSDPWLGGYMEDVDIDFSLL
ncbi:hypothetical protein CARUB_v10021500mg [Capsella rubella]|uniref:Uncharacterized protein n=1 Tax=Capsella rubella TaxID=81985 RepID=R0HW21_9BRAS|nr:uncharacterized protein LOC17896197 [Capsella rubella]EOA34004.1 hypothetical protein CARUB_v10021500mg [Capsella rubella]